MKLSGKDYHDALDVAEQRWLAALHTDGVDPFKGRVAMARYQLATAQYMCELRLDAALGEGYGRRLFDALVRLAECERQVTRPGRLVASIHDYVGTAIAEAKAKVVDTSICSTP